MASGKLRKATKDFVEEEDFDIGHSVTTAYVEAVLARWLSDQIGPAFHVETNGFAINLTISTAKMPRTRMNES